MAKLTKAPSGNPVAGQNRGLISLRRALFLRFGLLGVGAVVLFTIAYFFFGLFPLVNRIAASHFDTTIETASGSIRETLILAENIVRIASESAGSQGFEADQPEKFNDQFSPVLKTIPQATSIVAGSTEGLGWLLLQLPGGRWHNRFTNVPERGKEQLYFEWQDDRLLQRYYKSADYDPRQRLWFKMAMSAPADGRTHWTAPYKFFTTGEPGITVSIRRDLPGKRSLVVGMDLKLIDISSITAGLAVGKQGYVLVLTDDGKVLGLPRKDVLSEALENRDIILKPAGDLGLEPVNVALGNWRENKNAYLHPGIINVQGQRWLFEMHPLLLGEQTFWVAAFAPVTDFLPSIYNVGKAIAVSLALVLVLTFMAARRQARRISLPLEALATASSKIAQLDFSDNPPIKTRWQEINSLVMAQSNMLMMLRNFQATVKSQAEELKAQVDALRATQNELQRTLHQEQVILDNALSGILFVRDRKILRSNQQASEIFGYNMQEMAGKSAEFMYESHDKFLATGERAYGAFGRGESYGEELWLRRRDGNTFWGYIQGRALDDADPLGGGAVWIISDLTERQELDRMKDEMICAVGHEVHTPLTAMIGYAELMTDVDFPPEQRREYLGIIRHESERLAELFDNFLNLQTIKIGKTPAHLQPIKIETILSQAIDLFKGASRKHTLELSCQADLPQINGEAELLYRVFLNLISNAIKYSPDGGLISLAAYQEAGDVIVRVTDQGIGIDPSVHDKIFESFYRVDNRNNRRVGGTGLGLPLVRETVNMHGGRVWVESQAGKGSSFFVALPVCERRTT
ncbi:MAG: ATP-binding protein [Desulfuromonadales bacterium]|nr:ATP-binding protein [Desulfuromonadales bacterium]